MDSRQQMKSSKKFSSSDSKPLLPEDLIFDILTFVSINCLINSARYVSKTWAATIISLGFAEAHERRARFKHGLCVESFMTGISSYFLEFKNDDVNGEFERFDLGTPQKMGYIITSCDGILLLSNFSSQIFVVNPILKCWLEIPFSSSSLQLTHIDLRCQCTITRVPRTSEFKVFVVDVLDISGSTWYVFYVLRIGIDNSWKEIARIETPHCWCSFFEPIYSGGNNLYWITLDEVIVMDVDKETIVREYSLPTESGLEGFLQELLWMGNRLSCLAYDEEDLSTPYRVFILDFDSGKWSLYHEIGPFDYVAADGHELQVLRVTFCFWINDHIIFRVVCRNLNTPTNLEKIHFAYNVKTKQLKKIEGIGVGNFKVWLHTNSLASLPNTLT